MRRFERRRDSSWRALPNALSSAVGRFEDCIYSPAEDDKSFLETFNLDHHGLARFKRRLRKDDRLAVEASADAFYFYSQIRVCVSEIKVVDTYRFAVLARSKKKTDKKATALLARFLKLGWLPEVPVPTEEIQQLRHLFMARESMVGMLTRLKNMAPGKKSFRLI